MVTEPSPSWLRHGLLYVAHISTRQYAPPPPVWRFFEGRPRCSAPPSSPNRPYQRGASQRTRIRSAPHNPMPFPATRLPTTPPQHAAVAKFLRAARSVLQDVSSRVSSDLCPTAVSRSKLRAVGSVFQVARASRSSQKLDRSADRAEAPATSARAETNKPRRGRSAGDCGSI
jgi:hypothetical protein